MILHTETSELMYNEVLHKRTLLPRTFNILLQFGLYASFKVEVIYSTWFFLELTLLTYICLHILSVKVDAIDQVVEILVSISRTWIYEL